MVLEQDTDPLRDSLWSFHGFYTFGGFECSLWEF